ncbi:MAG TPA: helix-hairpin-helix domain-containing protein [Vicinamibacteria bacterium]|nr:helix-hairpin-helix domain-containing protein [Vicinamibacteria bacterium]
MAESLNTHVAARLEEVAGILEWQGANPFRVRAYRRAALTLRGLDRPVSELLAKGGLGALQELPGIGDSLARSIRALVVTGRLPMLERLRGASDPIALLATVPGVGRRTAERLHYELGIDTLEELETAAHDGRLAALLGLGGKRLAGIRDSLANRLGRVRRPSALEEPAQRPSVEELLEVDREYRDRARAGMLRTIAPRRLNPGGESWLPVLHTARGGRHYTALFSNTPRAHRMSATRDWVVLYWDGAQSESQATVITSRRGPLEGLRIVSGRDEECSLHYDLHAPHTARR